MSEQAPAAWYPDGQGNERYWDGSAWTENVRTPRTPAPTVAGASEKKGGAFAKLGSTMKKAAADRQSAKGEVARKHTETVAAAGALVTSGVFGTSTIEIYEGGYVRIAEGRAELSRPARISRTTPFERLRGIRFMPSDEEKAAAATSATSVLEGVVGTAVTSILSGGKTLMKATVPGIAAAGVAHLASSGSRRALLAIETDKEILGCVKLRRRSLCGFQAAAAVWA